MNIYTNISTQETARLFARPSLDKEGMDDLLAEIFENVRSKGDQALVDYTEKFDGTMVAHLQVSALELQQATERIPKELIQSIQTAINNITTFHRAQISKSIKIETSAGVFCEQRSVPVEKVGLYIPGGSAPLFSTVMMLAIPAKLAGCKEVVLCSPPNMSGEINDVILATAGLCGVDKVYKVGGAQAIAAMTFGTLTIPKVSKVFGPGNQYVTAAKDYASRFGLAMDMPAGPSELLVYADQSAIPEFVAADLLSQAEHGSDSQVILICRSVEFAEKVNASILQQCEFLSRTDQIQDSLQNSSIIVEEEVGKAFSLINDYAPEHLIIASDNSENYVPFIRNAGSVFLGNYCPESAGDYASGTNHTLPTSGWAKSYSGVNVDSFMRKMTFQSITQEGIKLLGPVIQNLAKAETLDAHANAVFVRLKKLANVQS